MYIIEDDTCLRHIGSFPQDAAKDDPSFCRRNFDCRFDALEAMRSDGVHGRTFDDLQVTKSSEI